VDRALTSPDTVVPDRVSRVTQATDQHIKVPTHEREQREHSPQLAVQRAQPEYLRQFGRIGMTT
jgi:hypothetical protein